MQDDNRGQSLRLHQFRMETLDVPWEWQTRPGIEPPWNDVTPLWAPYGSRQSPIWGDSGPRMGHGSHVTMRGSSAGTQDVHTRALHEARIVRGRYKHRSD